MGRPKPQLGYADDRPRIHVWPMDEDRRTSFSFGPTGARFHSDPLDSVGSVLDQAMDRVDAKKGVVVIIEPRLG